MSPLGPGDWMVKEVDAVVEANSPNGGIADIHAQRRGATMDLLGIVEQAIKREVSSYRLYTEAESKASTEESRQLFQRLAGEEQKHKELLIAEYEKIAGRAVDEEWLL